VPPQGGANIRQEIHAVDTTNILFICGGDVCRAGALIGAGGRRHWLQGTLDKTHRSRHLASTAYTELLRQAQPQDLIKFGLIPEFVERCRSSASSTNSMKLPWWRFSQNPRTPFSSISTALRVRSVKLLLPRRLPAVAHSTNRKLEHADLRMILEEFDAGPDVPPPSNKKIKELDITREWQKRDLS